MTLQKPRPNTARRIGEYLGCSQQDIEAAISAEMNRDGAERRRIGGALLDAGRISSDELLNGLQAQRINRLRACEMFKDLEESDFLQMSRFFVEVSRAEGGTFIQQDEVQVDLYMLIEGKLEVFRVGEDGEEIHLSFVSPGESIGEMAYFSNGVASAYVRAIEHCEMLKMEFGELSALFESIPKLAQSFLALTADRLQQSNVLYEENQYRSKAAQRSLSQLNRYLELAGTDELGAGIEGLIERLVHTASTLMDADRASLFLLDPATGELWSKVAEGAEIKEIRVPAGVGIVGWVAEHNKMLNIRDAYQDDRFNQAIDKKTGYRTRTILCGPVNSIDNTTTIGVIQVINKHNGIFTKEDESLFRAFSHQAAVAVENFSMYRKMIASHERMAILLEIGTSISQTLDLGTLITRIVRRLAELLRCERSSFFVYDADREELWSMEAHGSELKEIRFPSRMGLAGHAATNAEVVNVADAYEDDRFNSEFDAKSDFRTRSVLCVPVRDHESRVVGVAQVINKENQLPFDEEDIDLLKAIATQIAVAVQNARLHTEAVNMRNYLENVQRSISNGIITLDADFQVVTANRAALEILRAGDSADALKGQDIRMLSGERNASFIELLSNVYDTRNSAVQYDLELRFGGDDSTSNINVLPLVDANDDFEGLVVVMEDITREKRVKSTLTRYMSQDIVERMLADPNQQVLGGVRSMATVLFSDIRRFTSITERLSAEDTMDMLNEYFTIMVEEIFKERGVLDKFIGDAMMAVFGVPYPQDDDAIRAVRSALNMKAALDRFNKSWTARGHDPIAIGIGANSGEVISGNMGSQKRMDYTVIGDGVNIASQLESLNKQYGTTILISEGTHKRIDDNFVVRSLDRVIVKGKSLPVPIYEVRGEKDFRLHSAHKAYERGLTLYTRGEFQNALDIFAMHVDEDAPCRVLAERCLRLAEHPPEDWNGVWTATSK